MNTYLHDPSDKWPDLTHAEVGDTIVYCPRCPEQYTYQYLGGRSGGPGTCVKCKNSMRFWKVMPGEKERQLGLPTSEGVATGRVPARDPLEYVLNRLENAARSDNPHKAGYGSARTELLAGITQLRKQADMERRRSDNLLAALASLERTAHDAQRAWNPET